MLKERLGANETVFKRTHAIKTYCWDGIWEKETVSHKWKQMLINAKKYLNLIE